MTNATERIKEGSIKALQYLENGDSVRRACQKAGISVTSLYHNSTPEQREQAYQKNVSPSSSGLQTRGPGRRKKIRKRTVITEPSSDSDEILQLQKELNYLKSYVAKLERKLIQTVVLNEASH